VTEQGSDGGNVSNEKFNWELTWSCEVSFPFIGRVIANSKWRLGAQLNQRLLLCIYQKPLFFLCTCVWWPSAAVAPGSITCRLLATAFQVISQHPFYTKRVSCFLKGQAERSLPSSVPVLIIMCTRRLLYCYKFLQGLLESDAFRAGWIRRVDECNWSPGTGCKTHKLNPLLLCSPPAGQPTPFSLGSNLSNRALISRSI
jgi:hypothetical protein